VAGFKSESAVGFILECINFGHDLGVQNPASLPVHLFVEVVLILEPNTSTVLTGMAFSNTLPHLWHLVHVQTQLRTFSKQNSHLVLWIRAPGRATNYRW
jgi:hypothetical protein